MGKEDFRKIHNWLWEIPRELRSDMKVPARIYASEKMLEEIMRDKSIQQVMNVATLPGIYKYSLAMPDLHEGYGAAIGAVFATEVPKGVISPGAVGYDIGCGIRLLGSETKYPEIKKYLGDLATAIFREVPSGVGRGGRLKLTDAELDKVFGGGAKQLVEIGYGTRGDLLHIESYGRLDHAVAELVSQRARSRGRDQLGTLGSGNHFCEVQRVDEIFYDEAAQALGLFKDQVTIMIHTGSRGLGHQVATDFIRTMIGAMSKYRIELPDRELASVPFDSPEGQEYFDAMAAAANFAWANRQLITWEVRTAWNETVGKETLLVIYDVNHNMAKLETYDDRKLVVHRKGATRSFGPGHPEIHESYRAIGQPVLIPGSMGTASFVLVGTGKAMEESFGSSCHGAGRRMSRHAAKKQVRGATLREELEKQGIVIRAGSMSGLAEETPLAYKDVEEVVDVAHKAGIAKKVARLKPLVVIKG